MNFPMLRTKIIPALIGSLGLAFVIAACGGSAPTPTSTLTATLTPTPTSTPVPASVQSPEFGRSNIPEIIKGLGPSVVHIQTEAVQLDQFNQPIPAGGVGTGEIIDE